MPCPLLCSLHFTQSATLFIGLKLGWLQVGLSNNDLVNDGTLPFDDRARDSGVDAGVDTHKFSRILLNPSAGV